MAAMTPGLIAQRDGFQDNAVSFTQTYQVQMDAMPSSPLEGTSLARAAVAALGAPAFYYISGMSASNVNRNPLWYQVEATYKLFKWDGSELSPLLRPSVITGSYNDWLEPYSKDSEGSPVQNTAFDPFTSLPQKKNGNPCLQITKNLSSFPLVAYDAIKYTRNASDLTIRGTTYEAKTLLFLPPTVSEVFEQISGVNYHYFQTTSRLEADHNLHETLVDNVGFQEIRVVSGVHIKQRIFTPVGTPPTGEWPLNLDGTAFTDVTLPWITLRFKPYPTASWGISFD